MTSLSPRRAALSSSASSSPVDVTAELDSLAGAPRENAFGDSGSGAGAGALVPGIVERRFGIAGMPGATAPGGTSGPPGFLIDGIGGGFIACTPSIVCVGAFGDGIGGGCGAKPGGTGIGGGTTRPGTVVIGLGRSRTVDAGEPSRDAFCGPTSGAGRSTGTSGRTKSIVAISGSDGWCCGTTGDGCVARLSPPRNALTLIATTPDSWPSF